MKAFSIAFSMIMLLSAACFAQITIHNTDFSPAGFSYGWGISDDTASFNPGSAGANQTWNFAATYWDRTERHTYMAPSSTPHGSDFLSATRADYVESIHGGGGDYYQYQEITPSQFLQLGEVLNDTVIHFNPVWVNAPLPITYGASWTSVMYYEQQLMPGFTSAYKDSMIWNMNAWGTVTTPYGGSQAVLRAFTRHFMTFYLNGTPLQNYQLVTYAFINQAGNSVVVLTSDAGITDPNFTTGTIAMMGIPLSAEPTQGPVAQSFSVGQNFPNPFNPTTEIPVTLSRDSRVTLDVFDELGQTVSHEVCTLPAGTHALAIDGSRWATGLYFARVTAGTEQRVLKINLLK